MYTEISIARMEQAIQKLRQCEHNLKKESDEIFHVASALKRLEDEDIQIACKRLSLHKDKVDDEIRKIQSLRGTLDRIVQIYEKYDDEIADYQQLRPQDGRAYRTNLMSVDLAHLSEAMKNANIRFL